MKQKGGQAFKPQLGCQCSISKTNMAESEKLVDYRVTHTLPFYFLLPQQLTVMSLVVSETDDKWRKPRQCCTAQLVWYLQHIFCAACLEFTDVCSWQILTEHKWMREARVFLFLMQMWKGKCYVKPHLGFKRSRTTNIQQASAVWE